MRSWLFKVRRWSGLLLALVVALLALSGGTPLRAEAQNPGRMTVGFSRTTPPVKPGMICKGQQYKILAWPYVLFPDGTYNNEFHANAATVSVSTGLVGTITPPSVRLRRGVGAPSALFLYSSDKTGPESLLFLATMPRPVVITDFDANTGSRMEL